MQFVLPNPPRFQLPGSPDSNQNGVVTTTPFDLKARAHQAMLEAGFQPDFPAEVAREVQALNQGAPKNAGAGGPRPAFAALVFD